MQVWEFLDYRAYLLFRLGPEGSRSGARKEIAGAIGVHTTYISQVLKERAELSLEQADSINTFFGLTEDEGDYFILLVLKTRAGTPKLRRRFEEKIQKMREERSSISKRINADDAISEKDRERFYSTALYGAIHVLCSLPQFQSIPLLADALKLSKAKTAEALEFLVRIGVVKNEKDLFVPGSKHVHLGNESELILKHHINWRMHTISSLQFLDNDDLHYSGAMTLSQTDVFRVKEALLDALKNTVTIVGESEVETACVLNIDFYKLIS